MSRFIKVQHSEHLFRDNRSGAIVNNNQTEYQMYMKRCQNRESQGDKLRNVCKEINTLKAELREIKNLILKGKNNGS